MSICQWLVDVHILKKFPKTYMDVLYVICYYTSVPVLKMSSNKQCTFRKI